MKPLLPLIVCALALAACGNGASDKAGGKSKPKVTVLTFANGNGDSESLRPFADAAARLSGGTLRIEFKDRWRDGETAYEEGLIRDVQAGKADLGWAGSRAFDDVGVTAFDALHAPLLIDTYPLERAVLESPIATQMLKGLEPLHLIGLGILPGPLRKPLGTSGLVRPSDYAGATIAFQRSRVAEETLRALGARGAELPAGAAIDSYDGVEQQVSSMANNEYEKVAPNLTANVNLWPRPAVVFINPEALGRLDDRQRHALRAAARNALQRTLDYEQRTDADGAAELCRRGVTFARATEADLAALRLAVTPVYDRLQREAATKAALAEIQTLRSNAAAPPDAPVCAGAASQPTAATGVSPVDGVYSSTVTLADLRRTPGFDSGENNPGNVGHFRLELGQGHFKLSGADDDSTVEGEFSVKDDVLTFRNWNGEADFSYRWSLYRGTLTFRKLGEGPTIFAVHPWRKAQTATEVGARTPLDGVYQLDSTRDEVAKASGEDPSGTLSENYGHFRFVLSRGLMRYTQESEGSRRWETAKYTVKGNRFTFAITDFGGEAPNGAAERTGESFTFAWSLDRDRLVLKPIKGKISPANFWAKPWRRVSG